MILIAKRNIVLSDKTYRDGDVMEGFTEAQAERYVSDGLAAYRESPTEFAEKVTVGDPDIEKLDPEKKPSKRRE